MGRKKGGAQSLIGYPSEESYCGFLEENLRWFYSQRSSFCVTRCSFESQRESNRLPCYKRLLQIHQPTFYHVMKSQHFLGRAKNPSLSPLSDIAHNTHVPQPIHVRGAPRSVRATTGIAGLAEEKWGALSAPLSSSDHSHSRHGNSLRHAKAHPDAEYETTRIPHAHRPSGHSYWRCLRSSGSS